MIRRWFYIFLFVSLFFMARTTSFAVSVDTQNKIDEAEKEKEQLESELRDQEQHKEELSNKKNEAEDILDELAAQYSTISLELTALNDSKKEKEAQINQMETSLSLKEEEIASKEKELQDAIDAKEEQYDNMKKRIQYMYERPKESLFALLIELDFFQFLNKVDDMRLVQEYDRKQLEGYKALIEEINAVKEELNQEKNDLEEQKEELENARKELQDLIVKAEKKQNSVLNNKKQTTQKISEYLNQIAEEEANIGNTQEALEIKAKALKELYAKAEAEEAAERKKQAEKDAAALLESIQNGNIQTGDSGITYGELNFTKREMDMLAAMIYCESRGEPYDGQLAVGYVITNRVRSNKFPNDLESVLRQNKQFEPEGSGRFDIVLTAYWEGISGVIDVSAWNSCYKAAVECINGTSNVGESLFFRTHAPVPQLVDNLKAAGVPYWIIKNHIFYYSWVSY